MKRSTLAALLMGAAGLAGACSDSTTEAGLAGLAGTYDVALADQLVFVTSQDRNELRVLDLTSSPRQFIPAPNPLESLAIPVLERPDTLTRDVGFDTDAETPGDETSGPYVYARSSGGRLISVVASARDRLVEVKRLDTGALLTAFAARAPSAEGAPSMLYYALQTLPPAAQPLCGPFGGGVVMRQPLPGPDALAAGEPEAPVPVFCLKPLDTVLSLVVLPRAAGATADAPDTLALAVRNVTGSSRLVHTVADGSSQETLYQRPQPVAAGTPPSSTLVNVPARLVTTNPRFTREDGTVVPAGRYVFAVLDELTCSGPDCVGVIALDNAPASGAPFVLARDISGANMLTIIPVAGLPTGLTLRAKLDVIQREDDGTLPDETPPPVPLLGIMPSSSGVITLFRADELRDFDLSASPASYTLDLFNGQEQDKEGDPPRSVVVEQPGCVGATQSLCDGSVQSRTWRLVFEGLLPGLVSVSREATATGAFLVSTETVTAVGVLAGDILALENDAGLCATLLKVGQVVAQADGTTLLVPDASTPIPTECENYPRFSVRAGATTAKPFLLYQGIESTGNFLRRLGLNEEYEDPTVLQYYYHPDDFTKVPPATTNVYVDPPPKVRLRVSSTERLETGDRFIVNLNANFRPYVFSVDFETASAGLSAFRLPGPVVATEVGGISLAYIVYPSADGILQVNMEQLLQDNFANVTALRAFQ